MKNRINELILKHGYCYVIVQSIRGSKWREVYKISLNSPVTYNFKLLNLLVTVDRKKDKGDTLQRRSEDFAHTCFDQWEKWMYNGTHLVCLTEDLDRIKDRVNTYRENIKGA